MSLKAVQPLIVLPILFLFASFQSSTEDAGKTHLARELSHKQVGRYSVVIESDSADSNRRYEFDWSIATDVAEEKTSTAKVTVTFQHLKATIDDHVAPAQKTFGSAGFKISKIGFPIDLSLSGDSGLFVMPLLALYIPDPSMVTGGEFAIADTAIDRAVHVSGSGTIHGGLESAVCVETQLTFGVPGGSDALSSQKTTFKSSAWFSDKTGLLLRSEGTISSPSGESKFHIKRK